MKIRSKLQITFFGLAFILAISLMSIVYSSMVTHFEHYVGDRLKENVVQSAKVIDDFMFTREKDFNLLSNNPLFSISSNKIISDYLSRVVETYPFYESISFLNMDAITMASSSQKLVGLNILEVNSDIEDEFYKSLRGGNDDVYVSDIAEYSLNDGEGNLPLNIELLSNVIDLNGNVIGVLLGYVNIQFIIDFVYDVDKRSVEDEFTYLVNQDKNIVISSNPKIKILQPHPDLSINNLRQKLEDEENGYTIYQNPNGIKVITAYTDLSEYGTDKIGNWALLSTVSYYQIMNPIYQMLYKVVFAFIIILAVIFLLTIRFSRALSKPIIQLQKAVSEFDLESEPIELKFGKNDEVGNLSKSFNSMSKKIYNSSNEITIYKNHLEELVELRTNQLEKEKIKAQSADLMKSAFLATISHELRTPMNSIIGFTGILLKELAGPVNEEQKKQLLMVKNSGQHLLGVINDILDISKIEAGRLKVSNNPFNYVSTLEKTIEFMAPQANKKGLQISTEFSEAKVILNSDERRIEQVLLNLISNAIKFSDQGTILVKVTINNNFLTTQIIDQGIGITQEDQNKLFIPFIQLHSGLARKHQGTGLGLAICKNLIEKLGGTIEVKSKKGEGSDFTFILPL